MSKFRITQHKGFHMAFENGFRISVQFGPGNYCEKRDADFDAPKRETRWESCSAEIAVFGKDGMLKGIGGDDDVAGWLSTDQVAKVIAIVSSAKTESEMVKKCKALKL